MCFKTSVFGAALAVVFVASHASAQIKTDEIAQLRKELAALRAEVTCLKEEVAKLTKGQEDAIWTAKLKALREEVVRLTKEEDELKAAKKLADSVKAWKAARAEVTQRSPLSFLRSEGEALAAKDASVAIPVFSFTRDEERVHVVPDKNKLRAPGGTSDQDQQTGMFLAFRNAHALYRVSTWRDGMLARLPDLGTPFGLDLDGRPGAPTTDDGLKGLAELKSVTWLNLGSTRISDAGLTEVAKLKNLKWLDLRVTRVTDAGLKELTGLTNLRALDLTATSVTDAGVAMLQKALPDCKIQR